MFMWQWIKDNWVKGVVGFVIFAIIQNIIDRIIDFSGNLLLPTILAVSISDIILIIGIIVAVILIIVVYKLKSDIERIDKVEAFIFFPKGTLNKNRTLNYHKKHLHNKLIVNFKTKPPKAYYLTRDSCSYGWRLIKKYPNMWISQLHSNSESGTFTNKWCKQKGYTLIQRDASEEDLLEED